MEEILKAIPEKLEPTGLYLTEAERKHIAEALRKAGFQQCKKTADAPDQVQGMAKELFEYGIEYDPYIIGYEGDIAKYLTSKGYRRTEWISIEERLPSETEDYLVVLDNEYIDIRFFNSKNDRRVTYYSMLNKFLFLDRGDWHTEDRVTHWMPLPELPSGAESEEQNDDGE